MVRVGHLAGLEADCFNLIGKGDIRYVSPSTAGLSLSANGKNSRLARRGGVKRISAQIYEEARLALVSHLRTVCTSPQLQWPR